MEQACRSLQSCLKAAWSDLSKILLTLIFRNFVATVHVIHSALSRVHAAPVWDPSLQTLAYAVEKVQKFALKMCLKDWSSTYRDLLDLSELPTLQLRRTFLKLCYLYKIMNGFFIYPNAPLVSRQIRPLRNSSCHLLERLPSRTNASYFPHTISLWNNLPSSLHNCSSLVSFEHHLLTHLMW